MIVEQLAAIDLIIIALFIGYICWRGFSYLKGQKTSEDYFLAGRSLTWPLIGFSLYASNMSSSSIIGLSGSGYNTGISVFNYEWVGIIILVIFAIYFVPLYFRSKLFTMPELLEKRFDYRSRYYFSTLTIIINIGIDAAGALYAGSLLLQLVIPTIDLTTSIIILALITGIYTMAGGLKAVVFTDIVQGVLLTLGSLIITILLFLQIGSWDEMVNAAGSDKMSLIRPIDDEFMPWPTLILSLPILSFYFWCSHQHIVQRVLGANSVEDGRKGALLAGMLKLPVLFIMILPGVMAIGMYPDLDNPNMILPKLMIDLLPAGLLGLVLVGFIAALMSSIDSSLNSASTLVTMDFYKKFRPESDQKELVIIGRIFTFVFVLIASLWAPYIDQFPTLWEYLQASLSYLIPPVVVCFLFGLFWKKATSTGAFISLISGGLIALIFIGLYQLNLLPEIHYLYVATVLFVTSSLILIIFSKLFPDAKDTDNEVILLFREKETRPHTGSFLSDYRFFAGVLMLFTIGIVLFFW